MPISNDIIRKAIRKVIEERDARIQLLQRWFHIHYNDAKTLMDCLEAFGIVGPATGTSEPRKINYSIIPPFTMLVEMPPVNSDGECCGCDMAEDYEYDCFFRLCDYVEDDHGEVVGTKPGPGCPRYQSGDANKMINDKENSQDE